jgi:hypothetical protein
MRIAIKMKIFKIITDVTDKEVSTNAEITPDKVANAPFYETLSAEGGTPQSVTHTIAANTLKKGVVFLHVLGLNSTAYNGATLSYTLNGGGSVALGSAAGIKRITGLGVGIQNQFIVTAIGGGGTSCQIVSNCIGI